MMHTVKGLRKDVKGGLCLLALVSLSNFAWAVQSPASAGVLQPEAADAPAGGMRRVAKIYLSNLLYKGLYNAVLDEANGYAYFASAGKIDPGWVIKVDVKGAVPREVGATPCQKGEFNLNCGMLDSVDGYAYFGCTSVPGRIVKIRLGQGDEPPSYVESIGLNPGEDMVQGAVADWANGFGYFSTASSPSWIVKVRLGGDAAMARVSALKMDPGDNFLRRASSDPARGMAYFATAATNTPPRLVKIAFTAGEALPVRIGAASLDPGEAGIGSVVIDRDNGYAYLGTYNSSILPARVVEVRLGAGNEPPVRVGARLMSPGAREFSTAVIDLSAGIACFGTDHIWPAKVYKVALGKGDELPAEVGVLQLDGGSNPKNNGNIGDPSPPAELYLQSSVIDLARGYAYFGTDTKPGQVVKVAISQKGAVKGTRVEISEPAVVDDVRFYSHAADGSIRLAIYDDSPSRQLLWESNPVANESLNGWITVPVSSGKPDRLSLVPGKYWLAWQVDSTRAVPSYTLGLEGDGFFIEHPWGNFPSSILSPTPSAEKWSVHLRYNGLSIPPQPPSAPWNLSAQAVSSSQIDLSWIDSSSDEDGFRVERSADGILFQEVGSVAGSAFSDAGLPASSAYTYRVRAYNSAGLSAYSNLANAATQAESLIDPWFAAGPAGINAFILSLRFVNDQMGWACASNSLLKTEDGGETWNTIVSGSANSILAVDFSDALLGVAVGTKGTILRTVDGGKTWIAQPSGTTQTLSAVRFADGLNVVAVGSNGTIRRSMDGGASWGAATGGTTVNLLGIDFIGKFGWIAGSAGKILRTLDAGQSWSAQNSGTTNHLFGIDFSDAVNGCAVGIGGVIVKTSDGGESWGLSSSGLVSNLFGVHLADAQRGWVVGAGGLILATANGGSSWALQVSGTTADLRSVCFLDEARGWACGSQGTLIRTLSGGR